MIIPTRPAPVPPDDKKPPRRKEQRSKKKRAPPRPPPPKVALHSSSDLISFDSACSAPSSASTSAPATPQKLSIFDLPIEVLQSQLQPQAQAQPPAQSQPSTRASKPTIIWGGAKKAPASPPMPSIPPPSPPQNAKLDCPRTPFGIALYDFSAAQPGDLALKVDDVVFILKQVNDDWLFGRVEEREGIFPRSFVDVQVPIEEAAPEAVAVAIHTFVPEQEGDLGLVAGQTVRILKSVNAEWYYGESEGKAGQFPANFVELK